MTRDERRQIMSRAVDLAYLEIENATGAQMGSPEFRSLIKNIMDMEWLARPDAEQFETAEAIPAVEPEAPATAEPENGISKSELRDKLATYSNNHDELDVAAIMQEMGYSRLSDVPAAKYADLLAKVEAAVAKVS